MFHFYLHYSYLVYINFLLALLKKTEYSVTDSYPKASDSPLSALNYLWKNPQLIADSFTYCCLLRCSLSIITCGNQNYLCWESIYIAVSLHLYTTFIKSFSFCVCFTTSPGWLWPTFNMAASYDLEWWQWKLILLKKLFYCYKNSLCLWII